MSDDQAMLTVPIADIPFIAMELVQQVTGAPYVAVVYGGADDSGALVAESAHLGLHPFVFTLMSRAMLTTALATVGDWLIHQTEAEALEAGHRYVGALTAAIAAMAPIAVDYAPNRAGMN